MTRSEATPLNHSPQPSPRLWALLPTLLLAVLALLAWRGVPKPDLVVYGGTPQGVMAAVAAARQGLHVTLLVPGPQVGGVVVRGWLATLDDTEDAQHRSLYGGLYAEFYRRTGNNRNVDVGRAEQALWKMLRRAHVEVRLNTALEPAPDAVQAAAGQIRSIAVRHQLNGRRFTAPAFIDATDTADLAARAGAAFTLGRQDGGLDQKQMAATLVLKLGGVNWVSLQRALAREQQTYHGFVGFDHRGAYGFGPLTSGYVPGTPQMRLRGLNIARQNDGTLLVNALLIAGVDGTSEASIQQAYGQAAREAQQVVAYLRRADAQTFGRARLLGVAPELYLRETRHLIGQQRLHADEALLGSAGPDSVATGGYPLDGQIYDQREAPFLLGQPAPYGVPFGTLVPQGLSNLLVVSQAASFDSAAAFSARVVPLQMTLGEAAGTACGLAKRLGLPVASLATNPLQLQALRAALSAQGVRVPPVQLADRTRSDSQELAFALLGIQPGAHAASLLRRGMMSAPFSMKGQLGADQPVLAVDFLATLDHWLTARSTDPAQHQTMRQLLAQARSRPNQTLTWATGRVIFQALHEDDWEFENLARPLRRRDAARLLTNMFPAADRQAPLLSATSDGQSPVQTLDDSTVEGRLEASQFRWAALNWPSVRCGEACPD
jgi:FAD dependent oxidoreductase